MESTTTTSTAPASSRLPTAVETTIEFSKEKHSRRRIFGTSLVRSTDRPTPHIEGSDRTTVCQSLAESIDEWDPIRNDHPAVAMATFPTDFPDPLCATDTRILVRPEQA